MKQPTIYMKSWLDLHGRARAVDTDKWYLDLANSLFPIIAKTSFYKEDPSQTIQQVALIVALYMEDCVADGGNWRQFIHWHKKSYGHYLPFYDVTNDYVADEINQMDVALLLWGLDSPVGENYEWVENPMDEDLLHAADAIYQSLDGVFEEAPISEHLAAIDWFMETALMEKERTVVPVVSLNDPLPTNVDRFLKASGGESLMYFDSYAALKDFFVQKLGWENEADSLLPDLEEFTNFVLYANPKGLLVGPDVAEYFADKRNPLYNKEASEEEAFDLFCEQGICPFDLLKYAMEHSLLPDAQFFFNDGKRLLHENWDFVARWFLGEYYEGE